jgi:cyclopropane-fatty-acyl-phospholipid synthase
MPREDRAGADNAIEADMTDILDRPVSETAGPATRSGRSMLGRFASQYSGVSVPFEVMLPDQSVQQFGRGKPSFRVTVNSKRGLRALTSLDEGNIGEAYLSGDVDIDGDMVKPFQLRASMRDSHWLTEVWRYLQPLLFGQIYTNREAIASHYDMPEDFFLSFLDSATPCYTQGIFEDDSDTLHQATQRKFDYAFRKLRLKPGDRILEIGPGWGAWFEYASARGVKCTGISISKYSIDYLNRRSKELGYDWELIQSDLLAYTTDEPYDAIVIMGVIEHLPDYLRVLKKFMSLLKPGGRIFLDGSACTKKFELSSFMVKYIYPGNHSFLVLDDFLNKVAKTPLQVEEIFNDRMSYFRTFVQWAKNFDANKNYVVQKFGDFHFRRFRLYLWGSTYEFLSRSLDCYRMVLCYPEDAASSE